MKITWELGDLEHGMYLTRRNGRLEWMKTYLQAVGYMANTEGFVIIAFASDCRVQSFESEQDLVTWCNEHEYLQPPIEWVMNCVLGLRS